MKFLLAEIRHNDTNLSKENCFVFTGDPDALWPAYECEWIEFRVKRMVQANTGPGVVT